MSPAVTTLLPSIQMQHIAEIFPNNSVKCFTGKERQAKESNPFV